MCQLQCTVSLIGFSLSYFGWKLLRAVFTLCFAQESMSAIYFVYFGILFSLFSLFMEAYVTIQYSVLIIILMQ